MTTSQYRRIEDHLQQAEQVTNEKQIMTPKGRQFADSIRALLIAVTAERIRAENREDVTAPPSIKPKDT